MSETQTLNVEESKKPSIFDNKLMIYIAIGIIVLVILYFVFRKKPSSGKEKFSKDSHGHSHKHDGNDHNEDDYEEVKPIKLSSTMILFPTFDEGKCLGVVGNRTLTVMEGSEKDINHILSDDSSVADRRRAGENGTRYAIFSKDEKVNVLLVEDKSTASEEKTKLILDAIKRFDESLLNLCKVPEQKKQTFKRKGSIKSTETTV